MRSKRSTGIANVDAAADRRRPADEGKGRTVDSRTRSFIRNLNIGSAFITSAVRKAVPVDEGDPAAGDGGAARAIPSGVPDGSMRSSSSMRSAEQ